MTIEAIKPSFWDVLDNPPRGCDAVSTLFSWSTNCEHPTPAALFADMIGVSEDIFGEPLARSLPGLGYIEIDYLADALKQYAERPNEVRAYTEKLLNADE